MTARHLRFGRTAQKLFVAQLALLSAACASGPNEREARASQPSFACAPTVIAIPDTDEPVRLALLQAHFAQAGVNIDTAQIQIMPTAARPVIRNRPTVEQAMVQNYPPELRDAGIGGQTLLQVLIDDEGRVLSSIVGKSSGRSRIDQASVTIARIMEFTPIVVEGCRAAYVAEVPIVWRSVDRR